MHPSCDRSPSMGRVSLADLNRRQETIQTKGWGSSDAAGLSLYYWPPTGAMKLCSRLVCTENRRQITAEGVYNCQINPRHAENDRPDHFQRLHRKYWLPRAGFFRLSSRSIWTEAVCKESFPVVENGSVVG